MIPRCECGQEAHKGTGPDRRFWICGNPGCRGYSQVLCQACACGATRPGAWTAGVRHGLFHCARVITRL